jgi:hypothetical protein
VRQTLLRVQQPVGQTLVFFSTLLVLRNCWVWRMGPPGAAGLLAQRGHVPFGLKEGRARCTTSRRFGSEDEKGIKEKSRKSICECDNEVQLCAGDDTTSRDVVPETSILVPFAALRQMVAALISHPCLFAVLRLMRDRVAPVSASTWSLNIGFLTGFRFRNSGSVGLQKSLTLLTACVIALQLSKGYHFPKSSLICEHFSDCCCCCC